MIYMCVKVCINVQTWIEYRDLLSRAAKQIPSGVHAILRALPQLRDGEHVQGVVAKSYGHVNG